jgi:hypothetical protein
MGVVLVFWANGGSILTGHRAVVVTPPTAATTTRRLLDGLQTNLLCPLTVACFPTLVTPLAATALQYRKALHVRQLSSHSQMQF